MRFIFFYWQIREKAKERRKKRACHHCSECNSRHELGNIIAGLWFIQWNEKQNIHQNKKKMEKRWQKSVWEFRYETVKTKPRLTHFLFVNDVEWCDVILYAIGYRLAVSEWYVQNIRLTPNKFGVAFYLKCYLFRETFFFLVLFYPWHWSWGYLQ